MDVLLDNDIAERIAAIHNRESTTSRDPLDGNVLSVKVPWRYNKIDCKVMGLTPVQAMKEGDQIFMTIEYCGAWATGLYWKFTSLGAADN